MIRRIKKLEQGQQEAEKRNQNQEKDLAVLSASVSRLTVSLDRLCKVLFTMAGSVFASLLGFLIWYLQQGR